MTSQTIHVRLHRSEIINANHRSHWRAKAAKVATLRAKAKYAAHSTPALTRPSRIDVEFRYPNRVRPTDALNLADTVKPLIDGIITDAGLLPDDSDRWVTGTMIRIDPEVHDHIAPWVQVVITLTEA